MFRSIAKPVSQDQIIEVEVNGQVVEVPAHSSVWNAMALASQTSTRQAPVSEQSRSAYCAMGVCFECLVDINGMPNQQACITQVKPGMKISFQKITVNSQASMVDKQLANELAQEITPGAAHG